MTIAGLEFISKELLGLGINYEFGRWNSEPVYPYFVGNTSEVTKEDYPKEVRNALIVYAINLFLNFTWSIIFFNFRAYFFAFIWLLLLWATILTMIVKFYNIKPTAGYLQIPYLLWVTFAGYLNLSIFLLNKM